MAVYCATDLRERRQPRYPMHCWGLFCSTGARSTHVVYSTRVPPPPVCALTLYNLRAQCTDEFTYSVIWTCTVHQWVHWRCKRQANTFLNLYFVNTSCANWVPSAPGVLLVHHTCAQHAPVVHFCPGKLGITQVFEKSMHFCFKDGLNYCYAGNCGQSQMLCTSMYRWGQSENEYSPTHADTGCDPPCVLFV